MWIVIEPNDVLMFRGSSSFSAGASFVARSTFPPNPQVIFGAIRTAIIKQQGIDFHAYRRHAVPQELIDTIGVPAFEGRQAVPGSLSIRGPYVCQITEVGVSPLYAMPHDILHDEKQNLFVVVQPSTLFGKEMKTKTPFAGWQPTLIPPQKKLPEGKDYDFENASGWLTEAGMQTYLNGEAITEEMVVKPDKVFSKESHVGIGIDRNRRTADEENRLLYRAEFVRTYDADADAADKKPYRIGLLVEVSEELLEEHGFLTLGGESRFAAYQTTASPDPLSIPDHEGRIKVVLQTPAYFRKGWQPENENWETWMGADAKLVSVVAGSPAIISGWDLAKNQPKPLYRYMPTGSVYYFENATIPQQPFTESPISLQGGSSAAMGFGGFVAGTWNYLD